MQFIGVYVVRKILIWGKFWGRESHLAGAKEERRGALRRSRKGRLLIIDAVMNNEVSAT